MCGQYLPPYGTVSRAYYYDSRLSTTLGKFDDKVSGLKFACCQGQLASFSRVIFRALTSFNW